MNRRDEFIGSITREQFLFYEIRIVAKLMIEGCSKQAYYEFTNNMWSCSYVRNNDAFNN